jgi:hypothetical protein
MSTENQNPFDIPIHAKVYCLDGFFGHSTQVVIMPDSEKITHIVVFNKSYPVLGHLVSVEDIVNSTEDSIWLNCTKAELANQAVFSSRLSQASSREVGGEAVPRGELALHMGATIRATDGVVGFVDEFLINIRSNCIADVVLRDGHWWGCRKVSIPISYIDHYQGNSVYLRLDKLAIDELPPIPFEDGGRVDLSL